MTLSEMASFVCGKVRQSDTGSVAKCKSYLARRYEMLCAEELWKDLLYRLEFTYVPTGGLPSALFGPNYFARSVGIWHLPSGVDKCLALRGADHDVPVADQFQFFRTTLDQFAEEGDPVKFYNEGAVVADLRGVQATVLAEGLRFSSTAPDNQAYRIRYIDTNGEMQQVDGNLEAAGGYSGTFYPAVVLSASKATTSLDVELRLDGDLVGTAGAADTTWKRYPRIRLLPIPTSDLPLKALVKLKAQVLTDDNDEPQIEGIHNCLMSFAQADMLQRARQYGKAGAVVNEAMALLRQLKTVAVAQEAHLQQVTPVVGEVSGSIYDGMSGKGFW